MRCASRLTCVAGLLLILSACGGSGGSQTGATKDVACQGDACGRENLPPAPLLCGGVTAAKCPEGYRCTDDPADSCDAATGIDCGGLCVLGDALPQCGGLAGMSCAEGYVCVDDPTDSCEGGPAVDCIGICRLQSDGECSTDSDCPNLEVRCSACADGSLSCPHSRCDEGKCAVDFKPCSEPQVCGGISGLSCAPGLRCVDDPTDECAPEKGGADCGGICLPDDEPPTCGGIAGKVCPPDFECVDDPGDECDPSSGGADCPSHCEPALAGECKTDADCPLLRAPCSVCADGTDACPRSFCDRGRCSLSVPTCPPPVTCGADGSGCEPGDVCVADPTNKCDPATGISCGGVCVPGDKPRPCGGLVGDTCPGGYECVDDGGDDCNPDSGGADCPGVCEPAAPGQCKADDECAHVLAPCTQCPDGSFACPASQCRNGMCTVVLDACTGPGFCGGIAGFPCAPGFTCIDDPKDDCDPNQGGADCGGMCVREDEARRCAGFTGEPCPAGYDCVDDARDDCDPSAGGADCPGVCRPAPSPMCTSDSECPVIGAPCRLCADGTAACPRSFCENGQCGAKFESCAEER